MLKIKFLILFFSFLILVSCGFKMENISNYDYKFSVKYLSGGQNAFVFKNILTQQLIANNMYDINSNNIISISMGEDKKYQSTSITKVASRKLNQLSIQIKTYNVSDKKCILFEDEYSSEQSFLLAKSSANLSNLAAESDIFRINSENISLKIVDDLLSFPDNDCITIE
jgi:outer membrane lipopolysaccharide assembly protein LptE/RlpB